MFDTHVNLHSEKFSEDICGVLERSRQAGITRMLAICDRLENFETVKSFAQNEPDIWCSVGVHPHYAKDYSDLQADTLKALSEAKEVIAIGETGLDFHYGYSDETSQIHCLRAHIKAARQTKLPLILHTREADDLMGDILEEEYASGSFQPLLHCYTGGEKLLKRGLDLGAFVSASGIITFKNAHDVRDVIRQVPIDKIVVETDCPYLAPVPHRGRRNEPSYLIDVIEGLATLYDVSPTEMARITEQNALKLFDKAAQ